MFVAGFLFVLGALAALVLVGLAIIYWRAALWIVAGIVALAVVAVAGLFGWAWLSDHGLTPDRLKALGALIVAGCVFVVAQEHLEERAERKRRTVQDATKPKHTSEPSAIDYKQ